MFYELSKAIWVVLAPTHLLIGLMGLGTFALIFSKRRWLSISVFTSSLALILLTFTPIWKVLAEPLETRFPAAGLQQLSWCTDTRLRRINEFIGKSSP
jgi:hypothetical protein